MPMKTLNLSRLSEIFQELKCAMFIDYPFYNLLQEAKSEDSSFGLKLHSKLWTDFSDPPEKMLRKNPDINYKDTPWKMLISLESSILMKFNQSLDPKKAIPLIMKSKRKTH